MADKRYLTAEVRKVIPVKGLVMTYTHFVIGIKSEAVPKDLPAENSSIYPVAPYHIKALRKSRRLCTWNSSTEVERRYSELVDLRSYLVLAYPMLIFPPLPQKTSVDNINTTLASDVHLAEQRRSIRRFLNELLAMNDVAFYDAHVMEALQQTREVYVQEGLVALRADLQALTSAQAHIDDHKSLYQRAGSTSTAALMETTSKAFRDLFSYVSGAPSVNPYIETAKSNVNSDPNYTKWLPILQYVRELNISLGKSAEELLKLLAPLDEMNVATLNITGPCIDYDTTLGMCDLFKPLSTDVIGFSQIFNCIGLAHREDVDSLKTKVVELMKLESAWMASAEAAIEFLLALFLHVATLIADPYKSGSAETANYKLFLDKCCSTMSSQIAVLTGPGHKNRMHLVLINYVKIFSSSLKQEFETVLATPYYDRRLGENKQSAESDWAELLETLPWKS